MKYCNPQRLRGPQKAQNAKHRNKMFYLGQELNLIAKSDYSIKSVFKRPLNLTMYL